MFLCLFVCLLVCFLTGTPGIIAAKYDDNNYFDFFLLFPLFVIKTDLAICRVCGDPHFKTFDKKRYHYQGKCNFTLAVRNATSNGGFCEDPSFQVVGTFVEGRRSTVSITRFVYIYLPSYVSSKWTNSIVDKHCFVWISDFIYVFIYIFTHLYIGERSWLILIYSILFRIA